MNQPSKPSNPTPPAGLTPESLASQLFDAALSQGMRDPNEVARRVVGFLTEALFYAVTSSKGDVIVFLTETIILVVAGASPDEAMRKEMLKKIGETIANAAPPPAAAIPVPPAKP
jgi:hypothetical protein